MRDWTVRTRWVSVVVVIWVYSSSLALSSTSLWLAARYLSLSSKNNLSQNHHHHHHHHSPYQSQQQSQSQQRTPRTLSTESRKSSSTTILAAMQSRGGGDDYSNLPDYRANKEENDAILATTETNNKEGDDDEQSHASHDTSKSTTTTTTTTTATTTDATTSTLTRLTSKLQEKSASIWSTSTSSSDSTDESNNSKTKRRKRRPNDKGFHQTKNSSASLIPIRISKDHWERLSQRLQLYRRRGGRFLQHRNNNKTLNERQLSFLDRMALVSTAFWNKETEALLENTTTTTNMTSGGVRSSKSKGNVHPHKNSLLWSLRRQKGIEDAAVTTESDDQLDDSWITAQSDLTLPGRHITIVTTAALPWMTGTAVNPLLRAANLCRRTRIINNSTTQQWVTLVIPWLELTEDQQEVYQRVFSTPQEQEEFIRNWLRKEAGLADVADAETGLKIIFYPARYHLGMRSVFAMGDICSLIPNDEADVCILEEPEHCNWFRAPGDGWTRKFHFVVGVVHTNYKEYASAQYHGLWTAPALAVISSAMVRAYCHKVIKLSDVLQTFAPEKEVTSNVHGVRSDFLEEGLRRSQKEIERRAQASTLVKPAEGDPANAASNSSSGVYFIGKLLWAKGLDLLLELEDYYKQCTGEYFPIDIYGSGPDEKEIKRAYLGRQKLHKPKEQPTTPRQRRFLLWDRRRRANRNPVSSGDSATARIRTSIASFASSLHILGTTMSLEGGTAGAATTAAAEQNVTLELGDTTNSTTEEVLEDRDPLNESLGENAEVDTWFASFASLSTSLKELLKHRARERLVKIKETIKSTTESIEIPRTIHELRRSPIPANFPGRVDHAGLKESYKIFVNPSISEVLCTTTAEALAMGKFAIIPVHPSNAFFYQFPNCLAYRNKFEFVANLRWAMTHEPEPLTPELAREFSWEAATDRLIHASSITWKEAREREKLGLTKLDERIAWLHNELGKGAKGDFFRLVLGGGPASHQVKYQSIMQQQSQQLLLLSKAELEALSGNGKGFGLDDDVDDDDVDNYDDEDYDNDDEGLTRKFRKSSFVRAIRSTIANGLPSWTSTP